MTARLRLGAAALLVLACGAAPADDAIFADRVLPPWTPVEADGSTVRVWNRALEFGDAPVPAAIESAGEPLLAAPVSLRVVADGETLAWSADEAPPAEPTRWSRSSGGSAGGVVAAATTTVEFDGLVRVDLELRPEGARRIDALVLRLPLRREAARLETHHVLGAEAVRSPRWDLHDSPERQWWAGAVPEEGLRFAFTPQVWLGGVERGLAWLCETPAGWSPVGAPDAIRVEPGEASTDLVVRFVSEPVALDGPVTYTFALMATPVKPWRQDLANTRIVHSAAGNPDTFVERFMTPGAWAADGVTGRLRGDVTLSAWAWWDGGGGVQNLMSNAACGIAWDADAGLLSVTLLDDMAAEHTLEAPWRPEAGRWCHIAVTREGDVTRLWVDGRPIAERVEAFAFLSLPHMPFTIGRNPWQNRPWVGRIDEVGLFRRALDADELHALMGGELPDDAGRSMAAFWDFDGPLDGLSMTGSGPDHLALRFRPKEAREDYAPRFVEGVHGRAFAPDGDNAEATGNREGLTGLEYLRSQGVDVLLLWNNWSDVWGYPGITRPRFERFFRDFLDAAHAAGLKVIPYISIAIIMENEPGFAEVADEVLGPSPAPFRRGEDNVGWFVTKNEAFAHYYGEALAQFARDYPIDGIYMDGGGLSGTLDTAPDDEEDGAIDEGGAAGGAVRYNIFGGRELMRRVCAVFHGGVRADGLILTHDSAPFACSQDGFTDVHLTGELHYWLLAFRHLTRRAGTSVAERWPPDLMRAWFAGETCGVPAMFTGKHRTKTYNDGDGRLMRGAIVGDDEIAAMTALNGLPTMGNCVLRQPTGLDFDLWAARDRIGRDATWWPWWRSEELVHITPDSVQVSLWRREADGALMLLIASLADEPVTASVEPLPGCGPGPWRIEWSAGAAEPSLDAGRVTVQLDPGVGIYVMLTPVR